MAVRTGSGVVSRRARPRAPAICLAALASRFAEHERRKPPGRKPRGHLRRGGDRARPPRRAARGPQARGADRRGGERSSRAPVRLGRGRARHPTEARAQGSDPERADPVLITEPAELPIERGLAGPGLLARHGRARLAGRPAPPPGSKRTYARVRQRAATRPSASGTTNSPPRPARRRGVCEDAFRQPYCVPTPTGVPVQAKGKCRTGHLSVLVVPPLHVLFGYSPTSCWPTIRATSSATLTSSTTALVDGTIVEVGCFAHARRYF